MTLIVTELVVIEFYLSSRDEVYFVWAALSMIL
jgi:hypothetical protein